jgi:hypothetical protein
MNATTARAQYPLYIRTLRGEVKSKFEATYNAEVASSMGCRQRSSSSKGNRLEVQTLKQRQQLEAVRQPDPIMDCITEHSKAVIEYCSPYKVLARVKRQLRRHSRKPADMSVNEYFTAIQRINNEEIPSSSKL